MGYFQRFLPPYYKYSVFLFCGFELLLAACILAISESYYKAGSKILPTAYQMFQDTIEKKQEGFVWTEEMMNDMETYRTKLLALWAISTIGVIICMLLIIPQFFDFNDKRGNPSHLCLVRHKLAWTFFFLVAIYVIVLGIVIFWAWSSCGASANRFQEKFEECAKEEVFLTEIEEKLECILDDDKEVPPEHTCYHQIKHAFLRPFWLDIIVWTYLIGHVVVLLLLPVCNKQLFKSDEEDDYYKASEKELLEA